VSRYLPRPLVRGGTRLLQRSAMRPWIPPRFTRRWHDAVSRTRSWRMPKDLVVTTGELGGVAADRVERDGVDQGRAVLYLHGGAYNVGSPLTHRAIAAAISRTAGAPVWLPDYRRAPEYPYPAAVEDAVAAYRGLLASELDPGQVAIAGESAGAGLAMAAVQRLREAGDPLPAGLVLLCGLFDLTRSGPTMKTNRRRDAGLHGGWAKAGSERYRGDVDPRHPELSAIEADLEGLPPMHIQCGTDDILLSDSDRFAERARAAGVSVEYVRFPGMWHGFQFAVGDLREADEAADQIGVALRRLWDGRPLQTGEPQLSTRAE
jgi:acetyl esterase/lipase